MDRILTLVLAAALALAPGASAWCRAWCDSHHAPAMTSECHHHESGSDVTVAAAASCDDGTWQSAIYEGGRAPRVPAPTVYAVVPSAAASSLPVPGGASTLTPTWSHAAAVHRPLALVLRI